MPIQKTIDDLKDAVSLLGAIKNQEWRKDRLVGSITLTPALRQTIIFLCNKYDTEIGFTASDNSRYSYDSLPNHINDFKIDLDPFYLSIYKNWESYLSRKDNQIRSMSFFYLYESQEYIANNSTPHSAECKKYFSILDIINFLRSIACIQEERGCLFHYHKQNMKFEFQYTFEEFTYLEKISSKIKEIKASLLPKEQMPLYEDKIRIFRHLLWEKCFQTNANNKLVYFCSILEQFAQDFEIECELIFEKFSLDTVFEKINVEIRDLSKKINDNFTAIQGKIFSIPIISAVAIGQMEANKLWKNCVILALAVLAFLVILLAIGIQRQNLFLIKEEFEEFKAALSPNIQRKFAVLLKRLKSKIRMHQYLINSFYILLIFSLLVASIFFVIFTDESFHIAQTWKRILGIE